LDLDWTPSRLDAVEWLLSQEGLALSVPALAVGLFAFGRGLIAYRDESRVADIATSPIGSLPAGEVRVSGIIEPAEVTLVSPLQSAPCVYYRAIVRERRGNTQRTILAQERAVSFRVRDRGGSVRVVPRDVDWNVSSRFSEQTALDGDPPVGLALNRGPATTVALPQEREAAIAELLTIHQAVPDPGAILGGAMEGGRRHYEEARLEPGEIVTIVGAARPYRDLAEQLAGPSSGEDPELAADYAAALAAGRLETSPEKAWGNAAIPGFGIGRPSRPPELDPEADPETVAPAPEARAAAASAAERFEIRPDELVLGPSEDGRLVVYEGPPGDAVARERSTFLIGLLGAALAILAALLAAAQLSGALA
jgi:hypothetical protein